jgi:CRP-like cAMP-binding protein
MNRLARKLECFQPLSQADRDFLDGLITNVREVPARTDIIGEGERPHDVHLIMDGFACRYKISAEGSRHIMAYLLPGDFCDLHVALLKEMDHSISSLSKCRVVEIPPNRIEDMLNRPAIARALYWATLVDEGTLREWLVTLATRDAPESLAHLFCELLLRMRAVGLAQGDSFELPITQEELADTAGLSPVHVNRSLQALRAHGLLELKNKRLVILDHRRLVEYSGFNPNYLHLTEARERTSA